MALGAILAIVWLGTSDFKQWLEPLVVAAFLGPALAAFIGLAGVWWTWRRKDREALRKLAETDLNAALVCEAVTTEISSFLSTFLDWTNADPMDYDGGKIPPRPQFPTTSHLLTEHAPTLLQRDARLGRGLLRGAQILDHAMTSYEGSKSFEDAESAIYSSLKEARELRDRASQLVKEIEGEKAALPPGTE